MAKAKYPVVSDDPSVQAFYERLRRKGEGHGMAEILALRKPPGDRTDTQFIRGVRTPYGLPDTPVGRYMAAKLKAGGANPNGVYLGGLASRPGDPRAVVEGRDDIKRVCKARNWSCEGTVNVSMNRDNVDPGAPVGVADDLVERHVETAALHNPECVATPKKRAETKQRIKEKITPHWAKK